jgi:hypothetical protein
VKDAVVEVLRRSGADAILVSGAVVSMDTTTGTELTDRPRRSTARASRAYVPCTGSARQVSAGVLPEALLMSVALPQEQPTPRQKPNETLRAEPFTSARNTAPRPILRGAASATAKPRPQGIVATSIVVVADV